MNRICNNGMDTNKLEPKKSGYFSAICSDIYVLYFSFSLYVVSAIESPKAGFGRGQGFRGRKV